MASPIPNSQAAGLKDHDGDALQNISNCLLLSNSDEVAQGEKQEQTITLPLGPSGLRRLSCSPVFQVQDGRTTPIGRQGHFPPLPITILPTLRAVLARTEVHDFFASQWAEHKAPIYVFVAQLFSALMNLSARLLELGEVDTKLHPMQLLFCRMLFTVLACSIYIVKSGIPHGVLGSTDVRWLLAARSFAGFLAI